MLFWERPFLSNDFRFDRSMNTRAHYQVAILGCLFTVVLFGCSQSAPSTPEKDASGDSQASATNATETAYTHDQLKEIRKSDPSKYYGLLGKARKYDLKPIPQPTMDGKSVLGSAILAYHDQHRQYPPATFSSNPDGPQFSWRVAILPQLGYQDLYDEFQFDQPWDREANMKLLAKMPKEFETGSEAGKTSWRAFSGERVIPGNPSKSIRGVIEGVRNTLLFVNFGQGGAVPWTQPDVTVYEPDSCRQALSQGKDQAIPAILASGDYVELPGWIESYQLGPMLEVASGVLPKGSIAEGFPN
ncbi:DUF1559 family PulG-like putative transporter [Planctomicrobium piriforme]|nr:DUF1559 domain-containing protein [Planctomicrobium piriforme]